MSITKISDIMGVSRSTLYRCLENTDLIKAHDSESRGQEEAQQRDH